MFSRSDFLVPLPAPSMFWDVWWWQVPEASPVEPPSMEPLVSSRPGDATTKPWGDHAPSLIVAGDVGWCPGRLCFFVMWLVLDLQCIWSWSGVGVYLWWSWFCIVFYLVLIWIWSELYSICSIGFRKGVIGRGAFRGRKNLYGLWSWFCIVFYLVLISIWSELYSICSIGFRKGVIGRGAFGGRKKPMRTVDWQKKKGRLKFWLFIDRYRCPHFEVKWWFCPRFYLTLCFYPCDFKTKRDFAPILLSPPNGVNFCTKAQVCPCIFTPVLFWYLCLYPYFQISILAIWIQNLTIQSVQNSTIFRKKIDNISTNNPYKHKLISCNRLISHISH